MPDDRTPEPRPDAHRSPASRTQHTLSRRTFIGAALTAPAALGLAACGEDATRTTVAGEPVIPAADPGGEIGSWENVRGMFELDPEISHLTAFILAPHSQPVRAAIARHRRALDRDPYGYHATTVGTAEQRVADAAAAYLQTSSDLIALTDSTTMGLGLVLAGARLQPGDEVLRTAHEHYAAAESLRYAAERADATVRTIELYPPKAPEQATVKGIVSAIETAISASTRIVLLTWVHSASGIRLPLREIADVLARANEGRSQEQRALLIVDGVHGFGAGPAAVEELGCDVLISGCHKWLLGPRGTGLIWARQDAWNRLSPTIPSFDGQLYDAWINGETPSAPPGVTFTPGGYHSFEHRWALHEAFDLHQRIGATNIEQRVAELSGRLREGLRTAPNVRLHVPAEQRLRSGIVCFTIDGLDPEDAVTRLRESHHVYGSVTPYAVALARLGTCWINTEREVEHAIRAVRRLS